MRGYWFNQNYNNLINFVTVKFNRKYVGIPGYRNYVPLLNKQYTFNGTFKEIQLNIPLLNKQYKFNGSFNTAERE